MTYRHTTHFHSDYLDGGLDSRRLDEIDKHLNECSACQKDLDRLSYLKKILENIVVNNPGNDYFENLAGRIRAKVEVLEANQDCATTETQSRNGMTFTLKRLIQLSAAVTLLFGTFYISGLDDQGQRHDLSADIAMNGKTVSDSVLETEFPLNPESGINLTGPPYLTDQITSGSKR